MTWTPTPAPGTGEIIGQPGLQIQSRFGAGSRAYTAAMRYPVVLPGVPSTLELEISDWTGRMSLKQDGIEIPRDRSRRTIRTFTIPASSGPIPATVKPGFLGLTQPIVSWESGAMKVGAPLPAWAWPLVVLPLVLIVGGAAGGVCGAIGAVFNARILRSGLPIPLQILAAIGVTVAAGIVYLGVASLVLGAIKG